MSSEKEAASEVPCWQQQLECEWKTSKLWDRSL